MLLPEKHISLAQSILGLAGIILPFIKKPKSLDDIWSDYEKVNNTKDFPAEHDFNNFILAINYLFIIGVLEINSNNKIYICA